MVTNCALTMTTIYALPIMPIYALSTIPSLHYPGCLSFHYNHETYMYLWITNNAFLCNNHEANFESPIMPFFALTMRPIFESPMMPFFALPMLPIFESSKMPLCLFASPIMPTCLTSTSFLVPQKWKSRAVYFSGVTLLNPVSAPPSRILKGP